MIRKVALIIVLLNVVALLFSQDEAVSLLENRIANLEKRIGILEQIILEIKLTNSDNADRIGPEKIKQNWRKLKIGMSKEEVVRILGNPDNIDTLSKTYSIWNYSIGTIGGVVTFDENGIKSWREPK